MPYAASLVHHSLKRKQEYEQKTIPGQRSLHRGIHYDKNTHSVEQWSRRDKKDTKSSHQSAHSLLYVQPEPTLESIEKLRPGPMAPNSSNCLQVHHQKIQASLNDVYARVARLNLGGQTMQQRVEEKWRQYARLCSQPCGWAGTGSVPPTHTAGCITAHTAGCITDYSDNSAIHAVFRQQREAEAKARGKRPGGYAAHLCRLREAKATQRARASAEFAHGGECTDYSRGSALHDQKDRRIKKFLRGQLKRAHTLRRFGDPNPIKQSGTFDRHSQTLNIFNKTVRSIRRDAKNDAKFKEVKKFNKKKSKRN